MRQIVNCRSLNHLTLATADGCSDKNVQTQVFPERCGSHKQTCVDCFPTMRWTLVLISPVRTRVRPRPSLAFPCHRSWKKGPGCYRSPHFPRLHRLIFVLDV